MNRQQRRREEAQARHKDAAHPRQKTPDISGMPDDIKREIVELATMVHFTVPGGGCMFHAFTGMSAFMVAGIEAQRCVGGMVYRAGHDERRDVMAFVGPSNVGCFHKGYFKGHMWLKVGDTLVDFSPGRWKSEADILDHVIDDGGLGPIDWVAEPPKYFWGPWDSFMAPAGVAGTFWTPPLGRAVYSGFFGSEAERRSLNDLPDEFVSMLKMVMRQQMEMAKRLELKPRVDDWRRTAT
jgi:hypothetical protein